MHVHHTATLKCHWITANGVYSQYKENNKRNYDKNFYKSWYWKYWITLKNEQHWVREGIEKYTLWLGIMTQVLELKHTLGHSHPHNFPQILSHSQWKKDQKKSPECEDCVLYLSFSFWNFISFYFGLVDFNFSPW